MSTLRLMLDHALLPEGWAANVALDIEDGLIRGLQPDAPPDGRQLVEGIALPGLPNLHSHAFQRSMAGLSEVRGPSGDSFWTWRDLMYRVVSRLTPEAVEAITAYAYMRMLEAGFTAVGEFHYLHHGIDGRPYEELAELGGRIAAAASSTGIGLTLLPVFYAFGGFGGSAPAEGQRRFLNDPERFLRLVDASRPHLSALPDAVLGIAPHSLRAVTPETLGEVLGGAPDGPVHIHAAEQTKEVQDCIGWSGKRPVEWLLDEVGLDGRWCVIHATHLTEEETRRLARSGAVAGLCPITEASLGDGIFPAHDYLREGGRFGVGSDSNIEITAAGELRMLEYGQRLVRRERNVLSLVEGQSTGRRLYEGAVMGGEQALRRNAGALAVGLSADFVVLDADHPDLAAHQGDHWIDGWIFVAGSAAVRSVYRRGLPVVEQGRHHRRSEIEAKYKAVSKQHGLA